MFTTILASIGMLAGLGGLICGGYALTRARAVTSDSQVLADRAAAAAAAGTDPRAVRDVAVLHYDALEEMSGARSFSLAMLNSDGDGVVVTSINGRTESRTYAKAITRGDAETLLSPEEYRVIRSARLGDGVGSGLPVTVPRPAPSGDAAPDGDAQDGDAPDDQRVTVLPGDEDPKDAEDAGAGDGTAEKGAAGPARAGGDTGSEAVDGQDGETAEGQDGETAEGQDGGDGETAEGQDGEDADAPAEAVAGLRSGAPDGAAPGTTAGGRPRGERSGARRDGRDSASAPPRRDRARDGRPV
ncbi:DUF4446 family protein [Nocardiopsis sp. NRRL B-16309]|uniref:DUF4446 family protein n=1 Tax=Nocardiopsis sp. NRRL B-16309 TaxID=1519494 RepID=UPI00350F4E51